MSLHPYLNIAVKAARKAGQTMTRAIEQLNRMETTNNYTIRLNLMRQLYVS